MGENDVTDPGGVDDALALRLVELEIKRNRTMADLDAIQEAARSARRTMEGHLPRMDDIMQQYTRALERDDLPESRHQELYQEWEAYFKDSLSAYNKLVAEWERLQLQEMILSNMIRQLDRDIETVRTDLGSEGSAGS